MKKRQFLALFMTNYAKRFSLAALAIASIAVGLLTSTASYAASTNSLIKGSGATVYWNASNGKRYVFPNIKTFWSWYPTSMLDSVQKISDSELASIPLGGNVTYRPGYKLIKITTDPRVYAVSRYGILRWIANESVAQQLYGWDWTSKIEDVPDAFFSNYTIGAPIYSTSDFNVSAEYNGVYNPSDSITNAGSYYNNNNNSNNGSNYNTNGQIGVTVSKVNVAENDYITVSANAVNGTNATWIYVYDERTNTLLQTCNNTTNCTFTDRVLRRNGTASYRYYVTASVNGNWTTGYSNYIYINGGSNTTDGYNLTANMNIGNSYLSNGLEYSTLQVNVNNPNNASGWSMNIVDQNNNVIKYCGTQTYCETTITLNPGETKTYYVSFTGSIIRDRVTSVTRSYQNGNYNNYNSYGVVTNTNLYATQNCNQNNTISADITVNGPTTVTYVWERDGATYGSSKTLYFANASTQTVTETLYTNGTQSTSMRIRVTSPNTYTSNSVTVNACNNNNNTGTTSVSLTTDRTTVSSNQQLNLTSYVNNPTVSVENLITKIYDERNGYLIAQCERSSGCNTTILMSTAPGLSNTMRFKAIVSDTYGNTLATGYSQYVTIQ